jgi:hypothetical protein
MRIYFERSGGFMGLRLNTTVDTNALPEEEAQAYESTLQSINFFDLPADLSKTGRADCFTYKVTVETYEQKHTVRTTEDDAPEEMRPLLDRLTRIARRPSPGNNALSEDSTII